MKHSRGRRRVVLVFAAGVAVVLGALFLSLLTSVIWPGQAKLFAPLFCDAIRPDPFVVSDTYSSGTGETATNFTMYCVGERGDHVDIGWLRPYLAMVAAHVVVLTASILLITLWARSARSAGRRSNERIA